MDSLYGANDVQIGIVRRDTQTFGARKSAELRSIGDFGVCSDTRRNVPYPSRIGMTILPCFQVFLVLQPPRTGTWPTSDLPAPTIDRIRRAIGINSSIDRKYLCMTVLDVISYPEGV